MKRKIVISVMLSLLVITVSFGQSGKKFYKTGNQFMAGMKYDDAIVQFTNAINVEPSNSNYYVARGNAYEIVGKLNEAFADFEKALFFKPKDVKTLISAGRVCNKLGKYGEALNYLNRAKSLDKMNKTLYPEKVITLLGLELYDQALKASDTALIIKETAQNYYYRGKIYVKLNNSALAEKELKKAIAKDKNYAEPRIELADLYLRNNRQQEALEQINMVLANNPRNAEAYIIRSRIYKANLDYPNAINDISKIILIDPENPKYYFIRGTYYQEFNQHMNAIADFSKYISLKPDDPEAYFARAKSYEGMMNYEKAIEDYDKITLLSEFDVRARKMLKDAQSRLYELNRENVPPEINIVSPVITSDNKMEIKGNAINVTISGNIKEKSKLDELLINNQKILFGEKKNDISEFIAIVDVSDTNKITISARDEYNNQKTLEFDLVRTEINPPEISIIVPYTSDDGQIYIENNSPRLAIEGKITDESKIKSIFIEGVTAGYAINDLNPSFTATIDILNKNKITVIAEDIYGNMKEAEFRLNREGSMLSSSNPMGKTWVVFIENSKYTSFAPLDGPVKDINMMTRALANYQIHQIVYKKDLTKAEMEKFFSIELRDLIKSNQVKSLLIWYAGHGKFINDVGYWIPVDAKRDDEFTYFNLNTLRASMEAYVNYLTHTLVVTDACESGPSFYQAMRSDLTIRSCDDYTATQMKSAQVFSSAGYELAVDDSQFTRTFANTLANNPKSCVPIEEIVINVTKAVEENNQQKPKFGKITGLRDEDGTFFFIAK
ncbi:MAG: tetratricopeptide repeat protein [Bacteroidales bacterium]|nr:tetratricopeptide repeat protein [Bacteroidales bacterium]